MKEWRRTMETIGELVFADGVVSDDGNRRGEGREMSGSGSGIGREVAMTRDRTRSMYDVKKHQMLGDMMADGADERFSEVEMEKYEHLHEAVKMFVADFI